MSVRDHIERWRPIIGYEGLYEVSDLGRVRSVERIIMRSTGRPMTVRERIRKPVPHKRSRHLQVVLSKQGEYHTYKVHQLVTRAFLGEGGPFDEVRHWDGDTTNNRLSNLVYGSRKDNEADKVRHGTSNRGAKNGNAKLTEDNVREIFALSLTRTNHAYPVNTHTY